MDRTRILRVPSRRTLAPAAMAVAAIATSLFASSTRASSDPTVTVTDTAGPIVSTQLSTNNVWSGMLDQAPNGQAELNALHAPFVRIHVGDDGGSAEAMPEIKQGQWSFSNLDALVNDVSTTGQQSLMNIKFAPDWMWTCYPNSIGVSGSQGTGSVADTTFQTFAKYMARLVSYYNKGSMTTEGGTVITNPAGTSHAITYWELWNEPDLNNETPCAPSSGVALSPAQYLSMWNAVTAAMLQVDPSLKFVGPATAGGQFGSSNASGNQYIDSLMTSAATKPAAISFHGYGYWDNSVTDKWIFDGDGTGGGCVCGGIADLVNGVTAIRSAYPNVPVWLTEVNVNAAWGNDSYKRPWSELGAAWWGAMFADTAPLGVGLINQYDLLEAPQFGLIDDQTGKPYLAYYVIQLLDHAFPSGSVLLSSNTSDSGILSLAARRPDGSISVMVVNRKLASNTAKSQCGTGGVATPVDVSLPDVKPTAISLQQIDRTNVNCSTNYAAAPSMQSIAPARAVTLNFPGYGLAVLTITTSGQVTPTPPGPPPPGSTGSGSGAPPNQGTTGPVPTTATSGRHRLVVSKTGRGKGAVGSSPSGISCGPTCAADFGAATRVTLTAAPAAGSAFAGWLGAGCSGLSTCRLAPSSDARVVARFVKSPITPSGTARTDGHSMAQWVACTTTGSCSTNAVLCPLQSSCLDGGLGTIDSAGTRSRNLTLLGKARFRIAGRGRRLVRLSLTSAGRRLLRGHQRIRLTERLETTTAGRGTVVSVSVIVLQMRRAA